MAFHLQENNMRAHYLQHVPFEGPGTIAPWLETAGYLVTATKLYESTSLPPLDQIDILIIMGGPMSVNDEERFPWLRMEKQYIKQSIESGRAVLGICLGAQLIASAMGESIYPNRRKEIGWFPVQGIVSEHEKSFVFPPIIDVFHWHGETFDLPEGAVLLATSEGCKNQAFQIGSKVIGLQFHLEVTPEAAHAIVTNCRAEILPSMFVQPEAVILDQPPDKYRKINDLMAQILFFLTRKPIGALS
jgi:GMP synthase-like glutamine amidotransferase